MTVSFGFGTGSGALCWSCICFEGGGVTLPGGAFSGEGVPGSVIDVAVDVLVLSVSPSI